MIINAIFVPVAVGKGDTLNARLESGDLLYFPLSEDSRGTLDSLLSNPMFPRYCWIGFSQCEIITTCSGRQPLSEWSR